MRPCRHSLGPELHARWLSHLCGLCLTLRDTAGQSSRVLTGYDVLLVPVLVEAQTGRLPTETAGPCPLRGFRRATVVDSHTPAMQSGAAAALLVGRTGLDDKLADGDVPVFLRPAAARIGDRLDRRAATAAGACGLDGSELAAAPSRAKAAERLAGVGLDELLAPTGVAVGSLFAHTASVAGVAANTEPLRRAGDSFGRLVHLVDAAEDRGSDARRGQFNPLDATGTSEQEAAALARRLHGEILRSLEQATFVDGALVDALLGPVLVRAIGRTWPALAASERPHGVRVAVALAAAVAAQPALWSRRRRRYEYDPYADERYYRPRRGCGGPSCGEMLACDCCANCFCNECCGGDSCCCVC